MDETTGFEIGDVVYIETDGTPRGLRIVMGSKPIEATHLPPGSLLKLHDGTTLRVCHYMHSGWCRKVGRVGPEIVAAAEESHREMEAIHAARAARQKAGS